MLLWCEVGSGEQEEERKKEETKLDIKTCIKLASSVSDLLGERERVERHFKTLIYIYIYITSNFFLRASAMFSMVLPCDDLTISALMGVPPGDLHHILIIKHYININIKVRTYCCNVSFFFKGYLWMPSTLLSRTPTGCFLGEGVDLLGDCL